MRTLLVAALVVFASISFVELPAAKADACTHNDPSRGTATCYFICPGDTNSVGVSISKAWWYSGVSMEGRAYCREALSAICATQSNYCSSNGGGVYGNGRCVGYAGAWINFALGCVANSHGTNLLKNVLSMSVYPGGATATSCDDSSCIDVPVECVWGVGVACGVGVTVDELRAMFPEV